MGVKAIDAGTLQVKLNAVIPYFLEMLTHQATNPVSRDSVEKFGADFTKPGNMVAKEDRRSAARFAAGERAGMPVFSQGLAVIRAMADHIIVMKDGRMVEEGTPDQVLDNPQQAYTQRLMAAAFAT